MQLFHRLFPFHTCVHTSSVQCLSILPRAQPTLHQPPTEATTGRLHHQPTLGTSRAGTKTSLSANDKHSTFMGPLHAMRGRTLMITMPWFWHVPGHVIVSSAGSFNSCDESFSWSCDLWFTSGSHDYHVTGHVILG